VTSPSGLFTQAIYERLADPDLGFTPCLEVAAEGSDLNLDWLEIDWDALGAQVFFTSAAPADIESCTTFKMPMVRISAPSTPNENREAAHVFSGSVTATVSILVHFEISDASAPFEKYLDLCEAALLYALNRDEGAGWAAPAAYNNDISFQRGQPVRGDSSWRQEITATLTAEVDLL
jgi:hypothetical protein